MTFSRKPKGARGGKSTGIRGGRLGRTIGALLAMCLLGIGLATLNVFTSRRDLALATGPRSAAQREWLVAAAVRPDVAQFFKGLPHPSRVAMAEAIGRYDDAPLASLCGILLADFDVEARGDLVVALKRIAAAHPEAVARQFKQKGSFQTLGVSEALRPQGARALPGVVAMLDDADARPAAVAYLVATGGAAIPALLPRLEDPSADVRHAVADALGALRARAAVTPLRKLFEGAKPDERPSYLASLAAIGDPSTEGLLSSILLDPVAPLAERTAVALGLGRIGGSQAVRLLWRYAPSDEPTLAGACLAALSAAGPSALVERDVPPLLRIEVASTIEGPVADGALRSAFTDPATRLTAVRAAKGRSSLLSDLAALLPAAREDGDLAVPLVAALAYSPEGRGHLAAYARDPTLAGFIRRAAGYGHASPEERG